MNYKWLVVSLLLFVVVFHVGVVFIVISKNYELTSSDYYAKELKYEDNIQAMRRADAYHWQVRWQAAQVEVHVTPNQAGQAQPETMKLELTRPNSAAEDTQIDLRFDPQMGTWVASAPLKSGAWNYLVSGQDERGSLQVPGRLNVP